MGNPRTLVAVHHAPNGDVLHYWSDGWVSVQRGPHRWACDRIPQPEEINPELCPSEPNRELAPEVADD